MKYFIFCLFYISLNSYSQVPILVDIKTVSPTIKVQMKYFTEDNFVGAIIDGYMANKCLLTEKASTALDKAQNQALKEGYSLLVHDCYRPQRGVNHFIKWSQDITDTKTKEKHYPNISKNKLFEKGYIAKKSGHSRGSTVDLTLLELKTKKSLDMGTIYDFLDPLSNTFNPKIKAVQLKNRKILLNIMENAGFKNYSKEWWHFSLVDEPNRSVYLDIPIK